MLGLLGPTGSGKSTLTDILAGLVNKTSGSASIWGFDIDADPRNAKYSIGIVPQEIVFDPFFTPYETLENQAGLYGVPKDKRISDELIGAVQIGRAACRERVCQYVSIWGVAVSITTKQEEAD